MDHAPPTLGQTLAELRKRRGLTQPQLAAAADVGLDTIRKLEQGVRHTASMPTLHRLALALDVESGDLLGRPLWLPGAGPSGAITIRTALTSVADLVDGPNGIAPLTAEGMRELADRHWALYWSGRFDLLGEELAPAIEQARVTVRDQADPEVLDLAAQIHQIAASTLVHLGNLDAAHHALRQALTLAERADAPLQLAALRSTIAWVLLGQGRYSEGHRLAVATADAVEPGDDADPAAWALYGTLLVTAATCIARAGDRDAALTLLDDARAVAERTGARHDWHTAWSVDGVRMQVVDTHLVCDDHAQALQIAEQMPAAPELPLMSRYRHLTDVSLAHLRLGHDGAALQSLLRVEEAAPAYLRVQAMPRHIVGELLHRAATPPVLSGLAERMGLR